MDPAGSNWLLGSDVTEASRAAKGSQGQLTSHTHQSTAHPKSWNIIKFELALGRDRPNALGGTQNPRILGRQRPGLGLDLAAYTRPLQGPEIGLVAPADLIWHWIFELTSLEVEY